MFLLLFIDDVASTPAQALFRTEAALRDYMAEEFELSLEAQDSLLLGYSPTSVNGGWLHLGTVQPMEG